MYYDLAEHPARVKKLAAYLNDNNLDFAIIYYDETNVANGWYLTAWCPQFESGCVLVSKDGKAMILGGPESEPFAKQDSAIKETRNLPVFMVPDEEYPNATIITFNDLFNELSGGGSIKRVGIVGMGQMPYGVYTSIAESFAGVELVDITDDYLKYRVVKSDWERAQIKAAFGLADLSYEKMAAKIADGVYEYEVAAAGEAAARMNGAINFAFQAIVGSGKRANAVVPTASDKKMIAGELVMLGLAPRVKGYAGVFGHTLPVSGKYTDAQRDAMKRMQEVLVMTRDVLIPGISGKEIDVFGRKHYEKHGLTKYIVCPFAHTIGLMEAEAPFFGPHSEDIIVPGMTVCVDVSFFGHPELYGARIETGYEITEKGPVPYSKKMEDILLSDL
ncbi:MAG: Xaa-Pro peptidase family protein [Oscillospiraceae bacterium]|nr:Xaa-Pro peptidase family protein [Oscillospiraceae bacterium]